MDVVLIRALAIADRTLERALRRCAEIDHVLDDERAARGGAKRAVRAITGIVAFDLHQVRALERGAHRDEVRGAARAALV